MSREVLLKVHKGDRANEEFIFNEPGPYLIGRSAKCALQISKSQDMKISRAHLLFILHETGVRIRDLGSRNGTLLNGERMEPGEISDSPVEMSAADSMLNPGDKVTMGDTEWGIEFIIPELSQAKLEQATKKIQERKASLSPTIAQSAPAPTVVAPQPKKKKSVPTISFAAKFKKPEGSTNEMESAATQMGLQPQQRKTEKPKSEIAPPPVQAKPNAAPKTAPIKPKVKISMPSISGGAKPKPPTLTTKSVSTPKPTEAKPKEPEAPPIKKPVSMPPPPLKEKPAISPHALDAKPETPEVPPIKKKMPPIERNVNIPLPSTTLGAKPKAPTVSSPSIEPKPSIKPKPPVSTISVAEELETEKNPPVEKKTVTVPISTMAKPETLEPPPVEPKVKVSMPPATPKVKPNEPGTEPPRTQRVSMPSEPSPAVVEKPETVPPVTPKVKADVLAPPLMKQKPAISPAMVDSKPKASESSDVELKPATAPIVLGAKHKKSAVPPPEQVPPPKKEESKRSSSLKDAFSFDPKKTAPSQSISDQDVYEKLGTAEETVSMEAEEFDNLDDLVFRPPEKKEKKRTTSFKIKKPKA